MIILCEELYFIFHDFFFSIHDENAGKLSHGLLEGFFIACTPMGCLELIKQSGIFSFIFFYKLRKIFFYPCIFFHVAINIFGTDTVRHWDLAGMGMVSLLLACQPCF